MEKLFDIIGALVSAEKYIVGQHAVERLEERGIFEWQVVAGTIDADCIAERPKALPNPTVELLQSLPDGTKIKVVWAHLRQSGAAKLITVHFID